MQTALKLSATIHPGGRIEIVDAQLPVGDAVDVIVLFQERTAQVRRSIVDVLASAPGRSAFDDATAVDTYIQEERDAWDR